jgi:hypothetical protein
MICEIYFILPPPGCAETLKEIGSYQLQSFMLQFFEYIGLGSHVPDIE